MMMMNFYDIHQEREFVLVVIRSILGLIVGVKLRLVVGINLGLVVRII